MFLHLLLLGIDAKTSVKKGDEHETLTNRLNENTHGDAKIEAVKQDMLFMQYVVTLIQKDLAKKEQTR